MMPMCIALQISYKGKWKICIQWNLFCVVNFIITVNLTIIKLKVRT